MRLLKTLYVCQEASAPAEGHISGQLKPRSSRCKAGTLPHNSKRSERQALGLHRMFSC